VPLKRSGRFESPKVDLVCSYSNHERVFGPLQKRLESAPKNPDRPSRRIRQIQRRITLDQEEHFRSDYLAGVPMRDLATRYRVNRETVYRQASRLGLPPRKARLGQDDVRACVDMYGGGKSLANIGQHFGVSPTTVSNALKAAGLRLRKRPGF
jgi:transposase-like protein